MDEKTIKTILLPIEQLEFNEGQIEGVPSNPRIISETRLEQSKQSVSELPDMLSLRELLVYPIKKDKYVVIGGNQRLMVCKELEWEKLPCKIIPKKTAPETLRRIAMIDNEGFGKTDWDAISNEWDIEELKDWGIDVANALSDEWGNLPYIEEEQAEPILNKPVKITITIPFEQKEYEDEIRNLIKEALQDYESIEIQ